VTQTININQAYQDNELSAELAGVKYTTDTNKGFSRRKRGKGFTYYDHSGNLVTDDSVLERIKSLRIPPAWQDVWISSDAKSHLQATGVDAKGRKQYIYHSRWQQTRKQLNFTRLLNFGEQLRKIRKRINIELSKETTLSKTQVIAAILKIIDLAHIRVGNKEYAQNNESFGLTTLQDNHVKITQDSITLNFRGKSGIEHEITITNPILTELVAESKAVPGDNLFQYYDDTGTQHAVTAQDVNAFIQETTGGQFTAKDFRTWAGTSYMFQLLSECKFKTQTECKRIVNSALAEVASALGNTKAVCKKHYVHPLVIEKFTQGSLNNYIRSKLTHSNKYLKKHEQQLLDFLRKTYRQSVLKLS
jgi:DNA topoisomerase-1